MTLSTHAGSVFDSGAQTLVNTVNCVGVMGKGLALEFKRRFPEMYRDYVTRCRRGEVGLGAPYVFRRPEQPWVINFPTKGHWRERSQIRDIVRGMEYLEAHYQLWGVTSLAVPALGCANGGLDWAEVGPVIAAHLDRFTIPVALYSPVGQPALRR